MLLGTLSRRFVAPVCNGFQSPERIHAFGNQSRGQRVAGQSPGFNPQRGFMLLGTGNEQNGHMRIIRIQSPERIHAFGNLQENMDGYYKIQVSIPREDSCFWELLHSFYSSNDDWFQSPERIHAFGNTQMRSRFQTGNVVSIPREDSCFWELL